MLLPQRRQRGDPLQDVEAELSGEDSYRRGLARARGAADDEQARRRRRMLRPLLLLLLLLRKRGRRGAGSPLRLEPLADR